MPDKQEKQHEKNDEETAEPQPARCPVKRHQITDQYKIQEHVQRYGYHPV